MTSVAGGYPLEIIKHGQTEAIQRKFICVKCKLILKNPFQLFCGHRYCKDCLPDTEENGSMCPSCREEGVAEDDDCAEPTKTFPDNAIRREMGSLQVVCIQNGCSWEGRFKTFEAHLSECGFFPIACDLCQKRIPRNKIQAHLASKCDTVDLEAFRCPFGCEDVITDQATLDNHDKQNQSRHLKSVLNEIRQVQSKVVSFSSEPSVQASSSHSSAIGPQFSRITNLEGAIVVISKDLASIYDKVSDIERQQNRTDEELKKAQSLERQLLKYEASLHELQTRIEFVEKTSYDGFLIWKVEGYSKHKENAVNGQITSIYSPYFFTSRPGYKICTRLYLNGDGMGKGTHISIFFVLMKGPHDAILSWPFNIPVKFELMDLSGGKDNVVDTFRPDPSSSSFKRPSTNMNIASGCPTFISISDFEMKKQKFVKEDALYIKIEVSPHLLNADK